MQSILKLPESVKRLSQARKRAFNSIFTVSRETGRCVIPPTMRSWAERQFGSVRKLEQQPIVHVTNTVVGEGTLFNALRASRPMHRSGSVSGERLDEQAAREPFRHVLTHTPEDVFGRIYGPTEVTASNVAKYDALHGLVIFNRANPLMFTRHEVVDHFHTAMKWLERAHESDKEALFPVIAWNCLWKAGASLVHGHMQTLLGKHHHYAALERLRVAARSYKRKHKRAYFDVLFNVHSSLGLGKKTGRHRVFASITPRKEKEVVVLSEAADDELFTLVYHLLHSVRSLGVESFNVAMMLPPLDGSWRSWPIITRIVDRGGLANRTTDIGVMELYLAESVVASDPVKVWKALKF